MLETDFADGICRLTQSGPEVAGRIAGFFRRMSQQGQRNEA